MGLVPIMVRSGSITIRPCSPSLAARLKAPSTNPPLEDCSIIPPSPLIPPPASTRLPAWVSVLPSEKSSTSPPSEFKPSPAAESSPPSASRVLAVESRTMRPPRLPSLPVAITWPLLTTVPDSTSKNVCPLRSTSWPAWMAEVETTLESRSPAAERVRLTIPSSLELPVGNSI